MNYPENYNGGCQQCHARTWLRACHVLNRGKELYREKGCIGCHKFQGFDNQTTCWSPRAADLALSNDKQADQLEIPRLNSWAIQAPNNEVANRYYTQANNLTVTSATSMAQVESSTALSQLLQEIKKLV